MTLTATLENAVVASCRWHQCLISRCCTICRSSTRALQQHNALAGTQQPSCHRSLSGPVTKLLLRQKHSFAYKTQAWTADHQHSTANDTGMEHSMPGMLQQRQNNSTLERYHAWCLSLTSITCRTFELIAMFSLDCWSPAFHGRWYRWRKHSMPGMLQKRQKNFTFERHHAWCLSLTSTTCRNFELIAMFSLGLLIASLSRQVIWMKEAWYARRGKTASHATGIMLDPWAEHQLPCRRFELIVMSSLVTTFRVGQDASLHCSQVKQ